MCFSGHPRWLRPRSRLSLTLLKPRMLPSRYMRWLASPADRAVEEGPSLGRLRPAPWRRLR